MAATWYIVKDMGGTNEFIKNELQIPYPRFVWWSDTGLMPLELSNWVEI